MLEKTEGEIENRASKDTDNIWHGTQIEDKQNKQRKLRR